jgi:hypothetical protein
MTNDERMQRESRLIATIRTRLPDFAKACADDTELVLLHQGSFAADYQEDEYTLLSMAIKYAGLRGKEVRVSGKNRATLGANDTIQEAQSSDSPLATPQLAAAHSLLNGVHWALGCLQSQKYLNHSIRFSFLRGIDVYALEFP